MENLKQKLLGQWTLVQYAETEKDKPLEHVSGTLECFSDNTVKAKIIRPRYGQKNVSTGGYTGNFHFKNKNTIIHHVLDSANESIIGLQLERHITFKDNGNTLIIRGNRSGEQTPLEIHWKKSPS